jgi:hypothetical protein
MGLDERTLTTVAVKGARFSFTSRSVPLLLPKAEVWAGAIERVMGEEQMRVSLDRIEAPILEVDGTSSLKLELFVRGGAAGADFRGLAFA